jgi:transposase
MPERKSMRRIKECLRLHFDANLSQSAVSKALSIARSTTGEYFARFKRSGKSWAEVSLYTEEQLESLLFSQKSQVVSRPVPDWEQFHKELHSKSYITQQILWQEYIELHPTGYSYPRFSVLYRQWARRHKVYMRQRHIGGEKLFVDYSGKKPHIRDMQTGEDREVEFREWFFPTLGFDYHVEIEKNYYSAPWTLAGQVLSVRVMEKTVEVFLKNDRVAIHAKSTGKYQYITIAEHMPQAHQKHLQWDPARLNHWAEKIGPSTHALIQKIIKTKFHPQQGFRPAIGVLRLGKSFGDDRLESAAKIALDFNFTRVRQIADLLKNGRDKLDKQVPVETVHNTGNVRGRHYYNSNSDSSASQTAAL